MFGWFQKKRSECKPYKSEEEKAEEPKPKAPADLDMKTSSVGIDLIKQFEGFRGMAYKDPVGIWTIGYGHIKGVKEGDMITREEATLLLQEELAEYEDYIKKYVKVSLNQNQFDALVSWVYNLGPKNLQQSTMLKKLNRGDYDLVPDEMKKWNRAGGQVLSGLKRRREAEANLFLRA